MDALDARIAALGRERGCCMDLDALRARAQEARGLDEAHRRHEALSDRNRLLIVAMLARTDDLCACEVQSALGLSHPTVSHHMQVLREAGLVSSRRSGRWVHYDLTEAGRAWAP